MMISSDCDMTTFALQPTAFATTPLFCAHILTAQKHLVSADTFIVAGGILVRKVRLCGMVVAREERRGMASFSVDDGGGAVLCVVFSATNAELKIRLGDVVCVRGRVGEFRGTRQLTVDAIERVMDPNHEAAWWLHVIHMHKNVYSKFSKAPPPHLSAEKLIAKMSAAESSSNQEFLDADDQDSLEGKQKKLEHAFLVYHGLEKKDIKAFTEILRAYIELVVQSLGVDSIAFNHVVEDARLIPIVDDLIRQRNKHLPIRDIELKRTIQFSSSFIQLVKEGFMFKDTSGDTQNDVYRLIRHEFNLGDAVLRAVRKCCSVSGGGWKEFTETGVPHDMIGLIVRENADYQNVNNKQIQRSLKILQTQSLIMEVLPKHYKAL